MLRSSRNIFELLTDCSMLPLLLLLLAAGSVKSEQQHHVWVVEVNSGSEAAVRSIARSHSLDYHGQIPHLRNKFVLRLSKDSPAAQMRRAKRGGLAMHEVVHRSLERHPGVAWVSYQTELTRGKRDFQRVERFSNVKRLGQPDGQQRDVSDFSPSELNHHAESVFTDPLWPRQWYLHDSRTNPNQPKLDLHVIPVWRRNLTGRGVVVAVVDDGLERDHPDLVANYDARASYNYNNNTSDPMPKYVDIEEERHGTRCAGEIAMQANNSHCGVGIAFNARIGGVKILDGRMSDLLEARGLSHALDYVDIYSASWGPTDNGATMEAPGPLASEALETGIRRGRNGKGVIYVWASGNGGAFDDNCNCDGYASSVYTIAVSSATHGLQPPWYSEHCAATLATTFSSGSKSGEKMVSTDLRHQCTTEFTGTSASAPIASGIIALLLEANPSLTYRDVQHAIVWTAEVAPLQHNLGWETNAAGHKFHHQFGFGLFNGAAMVKLVDPAIWRSVPPKRIVELDGWNCRHGWQLGRSRSLRCSLTVEPEVEDRVKYLEHLQLRVNMTYPVRGNLAIFITSPAGTRSQLLTRRKLDKANSGLPSWAFMTVHFWGEEPAGQWTVEIQDQSESSHSGQQGLLERLQLVLHGTETQPDHRARAGGFRSYNRAYNSVKNIIEEDRESVASRLMAYYNRLFDSAQHLGYKNRIRPEPQSWLKIIDNN
ncbi:hypothetical protein BOX15_Mlig019267g1 [Macrostomum lignano]|uniref:P/Homo B domain-containing protein n=1 Tax=Macrostomum lignano TaxID=282301 RepID=A0A267FH41_9PLAT|nr:hypothetical protein BOX15_Mlig019267g1 [Macrostomum lignano]